MNPDPKDPIYLKIHVLEAELHRRFTEWICRCFSRWSRWSSAVTRGHTAKRACIWLITALLTCLFIRWMTFYAANSAEDRVPSF